MTITSPKSSKNKDSEVSNKDSLSASANKDVSEPELRNVLLMYDLGPDLPASEVRSYFEGCPQAESIVDMGAEINNFWFVRFSTESDAQDAAFWLRDKGEKFREAKLHCRIKPARTAATTVDMPTAPELIGVPNGASKAYRKFNSGPLPSQDQAPPLGAFFSLPSSLNTSAKQALLLQQYNAQKALQKQLQQQLAINTALSIKNAYYQGGANSPLQSAVLANSAEAKKLNEDTAHLILGETAEPVKYENKAKSYSFEEFKSICSKLPDHKISSKAEGALKVLKETQNTPFGDVIMQVVGQVYPNRTWWCDSQQSLSHIYAALKGKEDSSPYDSQKNSPSKSNHISRK